MYIRTMHILETERLFLRELTPEDADFAYHLNLDPEVIRYTGDVAFADLEEARNFLKNYDHYRVYGFGRWGVLEKESGNLLGWCGLKYTPDLDEYDLGFRFFKKYWNKGYATEAAKACLELGFQQFQMERIVGRAMVKNNASIRVLQKIGMQYQAPYHFEDEDGVVYFVDKS